MLFLGFIFGALLCMGALNNLLTDPQNSDWMVFVRLLLGSLLVYAIPRVLIGGKN